MIILTIAVAINSLAIVGLIIEGLRFMAQKDELNTKLDAMLPQIAGIMGQVSALVTDIQNMSVPGGQPIPTDLTDALARADSITAALNQLASTASVPSTAGGLQVAPTV